MSRQKDLHDVKKSRGFIVHPFETSDNTYNASIGPNHNKTVKSFKTLRQAKQYLKRKGVPNALYDSPAAGGPKVISTTVQRKKQNATRKRARGMGFNFDLFRL